MQSNTRLERQLVGTEVLPLRATKEEIWTGPRNYPSPPTPRTFIYQKGFNPEYRCTTLICRALIHHPMDAEGRRSCTALHHRLLSPLTSPASTCTC